MERRREPDALSRSAAATLWCRAVEQRRSPRLLDDPTAADWFDRLSLNTGRAPVGRATQVAVCARARQIDLWIAHWQNTVANPVVVELGIGLSSRAQRLGLDPGQVIGVDRVDVIAIREPLDPGGALISLDVRDPSLPSRLAEAIGGRSPGFIAEGLLMHLPARDVQSLLGRLAQQFADAPLFFDAYARWAPALKRLHDGMGRLNLPLRSTLPRGPWLTMLEKVAVTDSPAAARRLPRRYRLPGLDRVYALHHAKLVGRNAL